jgi:hypothetical protein
MGSCSRKGTILAHNLSQQKEDLDEYIAHGTEAIVLPPISESVLDDVIECRRGEDVPTRFLLRLFCSGPAVVL